MSDAAARSGLTLIGQSAGAAIGGPIGAAVGGAIGNAVGWWLFPEQITAEGPRLSELTVQASTYGVTVPVVYGQWRLTGNIIWAADIRETRQERDAGGKGGPQQTQVSYTYDASFAVGLCEGPIAGVLRIWADSRLVYDVSATADAEAVAASINVGDVITVYTGTQTQMPDPTIEAALGVGNVPAYRGLAYVVFRDLALGDYGNRIPNLSFEVVENGDLEPGFRVLDVAAPTEPLYRLNSAPLRQDPIISTFGGGIIRTLSSRNMGQTRLYEVTGAYIGATSASYGESNLPPFGVLNDPPNGFYWGGWQLGESGYTIFNHITKDSPERFLRFDNVSESIQSLETGTPIQGLQLAGLVACVDCLHYVVLTYTVYSTPSNWYLFRWNGVGPELVRSGTVDAVNGEDFLTFGVSPVNQFSGRREAAMLESDLTHMWVYLDDGDLAVYKLDRDNVLRRVLLFDGSTARRPRMEFVTGSVALNADRGLCCVLGTTEGDVTRIYVYSRLTGGSTGTRTVSQVINGLCQRAGLTVGQLSSSTLTDPVIGYGVSQPQTARSAIEALSRVYPFTGVESGTQLRFAGRNSAAVATINADDLGATAGDDVVDLVVSTRAQETDLPARMTLRYPAVDADYQVGAQSARRMITGSEQVLELDIPVALTDQRAAEAAQVLLSEAWVARNQRQFATTRKWASLEPGDVVNLALPQATYTVRIVRKSEAGGLAQWEAVDHSSAAYTTSVVAGQTPPGVPVGLPAVTQCEIMDLPPLRDIDDDGGVYAAVFQISGRRWNGAVIERRPINVATWQAVETVYSGGTLGCMVTVLPPFAGGNRWDQSSEAQVEMLSGALSSVTELAVLNGANAALIGDEIVQFREATLLSGTTYRLRGFLRQRRATTAEAATHTANERFVLLDADSLRRINVSLGEVGYTFVYTGVTLGGRRDLMYRQTVKHTGRAIKPLSPVLLNAVRGADDRLRFTWTRRARINAGWNDFADVPLDEPDELYDVELVTNDVLALRLLYLPDWDRREVEWTLGQQIAATNRPVQQVVLRVWQKSNRVGRGELAEAVVSAPLMPFVRNWNDGSLAGHTLFGNGTPAHAIVSSRYQLSNGSGGTSNSRLDTAYSVANFVLEVDLVVSSNAGRHGVVYRTTGWGNVSVGAFAYAAWVLPVAGTGLQLRLQSGGNNPAGGFENDLQIVSIPGPDSGTFRMRLEVSGSTHRVFINGVQRISVVDSAFLSPGQFGLYMTLNTAVAQFDNLRIDY
jgi:hypothetical protein